MGRGRAPCCEKVGLNRGSWTPEEDMRLVAYIQKFGHGNWRSLPKRAGLLRCGKSCRLRWINYLRPDIKRGNFTKEEEETIIRLHGLLGNKWSKIASCLPGRTDNEIKNVWNTHLKKRLTPKDQNSMANKPVQEAPSSPSSTTTSCSDHSEGKSDGECTINPGIDSSNSSAEKIEIPVEPDMDNMWEMLGDCLSSPQQKAEAEDDDMHQVINLGLAPNDLKVSPSCYPSSDFLAADCGDAGEGDGQVLNDMNLEEANVDPLEIPEVPIEPEIWSMIDDNGDAGLFSPELGAMEGIVGEGDATNLEQASSGEGESREWLEYLEKELGLCGASDDNNQDNLVRDVGEQMAPWLEMEGDPLLSSYFQKGASPPSPFDSHDLKVS